MKRKASILLCGLLLALAAIPASANEEDEKLFPLFISELDKRHEQLKNVPMPAVEIRRTRESPDEPLYVLTFRTAREVQIFTAALKQEGILYSTLPRNALQIVLFNTDLMRYVYSDVRGL